jgi:hypothetical protein
VLWSLEGANIKVLIISRSEFCGQSGVLIQFIVHNYNMRNIVPLYTTNNKKSNNYPRLIFLLIWDLLDQGFPLLPFSSDDSDMYLS